MVREAGPGSPYDIVIQWKRALARMPIGAATQEGIRIEISPLDFLFDGVLWVQHRGVRTGSRSAFRRARRIAFGTDPQGIQSTNLAEASGRILRFDSAGRP